MIVHCGDTVLFLQADKKWSRYYMVGRVIDTDERFTVVVALTGEEVVCYGYEVVVIDEGVDEGG